MSLAFGAALLPLSTQREGKSYASDRQEAAGRCVDGVNRQRANIGQYVLSERSLTELADV